MEQKGKSKAKMGEGKRKCRSRGSKPRAGRERKGVYNPQRWAIWSFSESFRLLWLLLVACSRELVFVPIQLNHHSAPHVSSTLAYAAKRPTLALRYCTLFVQGLQFGTHAPRIAGELRICTQNKSLCFGQLFKSTNSYCMTVNVGSHCRRLYSTPTMTCCRSETTGLGSGTGQ